VREKGALLRESLRALKRSGVFAWQDDKMPSRAGRAIQNNPLITVGMRKSEAEQEKTNRTLD
jgi:hypothetical protein